MFIKLRSIIAVLIALSVFAGFGIANAAVIGGLADNPGIAFLPPALNNYVAPNGLGDALIYNYYNVRNNNVTFFTVVNTDSVNGVRARVRIREAADIATGSGCPLVSSKDVNPRGSYELLDFDICLSKNDMWTGYIIQNGTSASLCSKDSDTLYWNGSTGNQAFNGTCIPLKFGVQNTNTAITADNTLEGYMEILAENNIAGALIPAGPNGVPAASGLWNCDPQYDPLPRTDVGNVLFGNAVVMSGNAAGATFTYDATAIGNFALGSIYSGLLSQKPTLKDGIDGIAGVNFILAKNKLMSIYDVIDGRTEYIVTLPTKALTQACNSSASGVAPNATDIFNGNGVTYQFWDDKENLSPGGTCLNSPCTSPDDKLPYEVNAILPKTGNSIMPPGTSAATSIEILPITAPLYNFGWFLVDLDSLTLNTANSPAHSTTFPITGTRTARGWPALGLTLFDAGNGISTGAWVMQNTTDVR